jgi:uncharacterized protein YcnI
MKYSAWSSLAISACSALVLVGQATAHVVATPSFVTGGSTSTLTFAAPNERDVPMTGLAVTVPAGFTIVEARPAGAWHASVGGQTATWRGGRLVPKGTHSFSLDVKARTEAGTVELEAEQTYPDRGTVRWPISLTVVPGAKPSENLGTALVVGVLGLLGLTAAVILLWQRRLKSLQEK